jgi:hypothetical protein
MPRHDAGEERASCGRYLGPQSSARRDRKLDRLAHEVVQIQPLGFIDQTDRFKRHIRGFSDRASEILRRYFGDIIIELGANEVALPLTFTGVTEKPKKTTTLTKTSVFEAQRGLLVLSGIVSVPDRPELGVDSNKPILRVDEPKVTSHDGPGRLNAAIGNRPKSLRVEDLSSAVGPELTISEVVEINGRPVPSYGGIATLQNMWNNPPNTYRGRYS